MRVCGVGLAAYVLHVHGVGGLEPRHCPLRPGPLVFLFSSLLFSSLSLSLSLSRARALSLSLHLSRSLSISLDRHVATADTVTCGTDVPRD